MLHLCSVSLFATQVGVPVFPQQEIEKFLEFSRLFLRKDLAASTVSCGAGRGSVNSSSRLCRGSSHILPLSGESELSQGLDEVLP